MKAEIKGSDPVDTSARQMGAFWQLQQMIKTLARPRSQSMEFTRDENNLLLRYFNAWQWYQYKDNSPPPQEQARWRKLRDLYENDPGVRVELLQKSFSPEFRAAYDRATGKQPPPTATSQPRIRPTAPPSASAGTKAKKSLTQGDKSDANRRLLDELKSLDESAAKEALAVGADIDWKDEEKDGATILIQLVQRFNPSKTIKFLLDNGADATIKDNRQNRS